MAHTGSGEPSTTVTSYEDGPLLLRGNFELRTPGGDVIDPGRDTVALCRCGGSAVKPFCDGTHKSLGFRAPAGPDPAPDGQRYGEAGTVAEISADG
ncbi:CDGSH-type Zn-finger protein [Micromonospora pisi]|uniref:CDGSH-type Zn-finger protein n=1 Tax=Micromonospora pisi TaxID=589240 RepID=A0A495JPL2_9ACTN|nr:CDGSH iron-sulfur domain-containing protein [Micromonospora pisi]RKR90292.1 CDGSH-type Zn-finger protein [Micromonospora pisi]